MTGPEDVVDPDDDGIREVDEEDGAEIDQGAKRVRADSDGVATGVGDRERVERSTAEDDVTSIRTMAITSISSINTSGRSTRPVLRARLTSLIGLSSVASRCVDDPRRKVPSPAAAGSGASLSLSTGLIS